LPSGVLAEQLDPLTGAPLSVAPLAWSHAALVTLVEEYQRKVDELR
jgi:GH15 family glucan-1,4-alpha-glucosidase